MCGILILNHTRPRWKKHRKGLNFEFLNYCYKELSGVVGLSPSLGELFQQPLLEVGFRADIEHISEAAQQRVVLHYGRRCGPARIPLAFLSRC